MQNLEQFRSKNPAYNNVPDDELVRGLYFKFYQDRMTLKDFTNKIEYKPKLPRQPMFGLTTKTEQEEAAQLMVPEHEEINIFKTFGALAGGLIAFPISGLAGYAKLLTSGPDEAKKTIEQIQALPMKLLETEKEQEVAEKILWPVDKVQYAAKRYGDKMFEAFPNQPELAALTATTVEATAFLALPKLGAKLKANIRAGKVAEARKMVLDFHRERLAKIKSEPQRLKELIEAERKIEGEVEAFKRREYGEKLTEQRKSVTIEEQVKKDFQKYGTYKVGEQGATFSFMGTQGIYEAMARQLPMLKQKAKAMSAAAADILDVEAPWKRIYAPETGFQVKNYFSMRDRWETYGLDYARQNGELFKFDKNIAPDVVLSAENPAYLNALPGELKAQVSSASQHLSSLFKAAQKEYAKRDVKLDFKERIASELSKLIDDAEAAGKPAQEIAGLKQARETARRMNFVHIPSAMWFEGMLAKDPAGFSSKLKLLATQKRKTLMIKDLIDQGVINKTDIHPADVIASYSRRMGRDFALLNIVDAAVKEGKASTKPKEGFLPAPPNAGILRGKYLHPLLHDLVYEMTRHYDRKIGAVESLFSITKMTAFYNPLFLPMYDMIQASMLGSVLNIKMPKYAARAIRDVWKKSPDYFEALDNGLASKPFNNPMRSWKHMVESAKRSRGGQVFDIIKDPNVLKTVYNASWHVAWRLDETVRMMSYNYLKEKGFAPREAAQVAARFHADYASVPAHTRRSLNKIFFTPTFKITMGKLYKDMIGSTITGKFFRDKAGRKYARGLVTTAAILQGFDSFMISLMDFERDEWGRRYKKVVDTDEGPKEVVFTWSTPANMFLKYYYRARDSMKPEIESPILDFIQRNIWEFHPLYRVSWQIATNDNGRGDSIVNRWDSDIDKAVKRSWYATKSIVQLLGTMDKELSTKEAMNKFAKETNKTFEMITRPFAVKYMRSIEGRRKAFKLRKLNKDFQRTLFREALKGRIMTEEQIQNFQEEYFQIIEEK